VCPAASNPASLQGGLWAATHPVVPCGPQASNIKKILAGLPVQIGSYVPNSRVHVSMAPDVRAIMSLQDVWAGSTVNARKTCGQVATVRHQCSVGPVDHSSSTAIVPDDPTAWHHVADRVWRGRMTIRDIPTPLKISFATSIR
jgi:hypothetical protein